MVKESGLRLKHRPKTKKEKTKLTLKKVWWFIWEDDSWASWFVNIILAFLIIKFLVYPGLGLALQTSHPIVAVVSSSMEHDGSFDEWWSSEAICKGSKECAQGDFYAELGISKEEFREFSLKNGFNKGDIMVLYGKKPKDLEVGDVIVYMANRPDPIIHRVVITKETDGHHSFTTKGDHNVGSFYFESYIPEENYVGKAVLRIPLLGYIKLLFVKFLGLFGV